VVTGVEHAAWVRRQAPEIPPRRIIMEEVGRNTAAAVALAAHRILAERGDRIMLVVPSDHHIEPARGFQATVRRAARVVAKTDWLMAIGVPARSAETGFGYIVPSRSEDPRGIARVERFVEKPDAGHAGRLIRGKRALWNSGIFVWRAGRILRELHAFRPDLAGPIDRWARRASKGAWRVPRRVLSRVASVPIDRAVLERSRRLLVARGSFVWSDLGSLGALGELLPKRRSGNAGVGAMLAAGSTGCLAFNEGGLTAFLGVRGIAVIRSGTTVLVCDRGQTQAVRRIVESLVGPLEKYR
jgi:mannose-1-phosphate guanylyltransferase